MQVTTVTGPVSPSALGITLSHEHLFVDLRNQFVDFSDPEKRRIGRQKVCRGNLDLIRSNPYAIRDNLLLEDVETAICEVLYFKELNGKTIVDCSCLGLNRDVKKLHAVALRTGLNIIAGSGYYTYDTHPPQTDRWSAEEIAEQIVRDLTEGINETEIKAGVIGEVGTSEPIHPNEEKNLIAAAIAFRKTGAPVYVHTYPWGGSAIQAVDTLLSHGARPDKIVICHLDVEPDTEYIRAVLDRGVFLEFDNFGKEFHIDATEKSFAGGNFCRDIDRVRIVKKLVEWGYGKQILITNDICLKGMLRAYGGWGYAHILKNIVPMMRQEGIDPETITLFMQDNPRRLFS